MDTTLDGLLNRSIMIEQPIRGFRVAIDTVFLGAAVPAVAGQRVLELGCGVGGVMLCLGYRVPGIHILGIEIQEELVKICQRNIERNKLNATLEVTHGDVTKLEVTNAVDHVMINPPYHEEDKHDVSIDTQKRIANAEKDGDLGIWIASAAQALKAGGALTMIHRADRLAEIIDLLHVFFGTVEVLPLAAKIGAVPRRIIVRGRKDAAWSVTTRDSFILHSDQGGYSDQAEAVLRMGKRLN